MSFSGRGFRGRPFRGRSDGGGLRGGFRPNFRGGFSGRGDGFGGRRGFQSRFVNRGRGNMSGRGGMRTGYGRRDDWSTGLEAGRTRSPTRDDRFGGHTLDSDQSHASQFSGRTQVKEEIDATSRPIIGGDDVLSFKAPERKPSKMGRIIIRNLPFSTKEDDLKTLMGKCGKIMEVRIPLKEDGKMRGFAFVQFQSINSAETAIKMFNSTKLKDRPIAVDWAVAKSRYDEALAARATETPTVKLEDTKPEMSDSEDLHDGSPSDEEEQDQDQDDGGKSGSEESASSDDEEKPIVKKESSDSSDDGSNGEDDGNTKKKKPRTLKKPSDVEEGRTLFIRNLPYEETEESLLNFFRKYGVVRYFKLCSHTDSGHSKGSGFVQYREKESADKCLAASSGSEGIVLDGRALVICVAENPKQRRKAERQKHEKVPKDNRNLSLLKEGRQMLEKDSDPMSQNDMRKRSELDKKKAETLKNLHMFVSTTRLSVHNIPKSIDDHGLREVFLNATGLKKYSIKESRVIRDLQTLDHTGVGKSRGFGFVEFKNHADAAKALAAINNNPTIFKSDKRPIVEFALENRVALQKKQRRMENSKAKLVSLKSNQYVGSKQPATASKQQAARPPVPSIRKPVSTAKPNAAVKRQPVPNRNESTAAAKAPVKDRNIRKTAEPIEPKKRPNKRKRVEPAEEQDDFSKTVEKYKKRLMRSEDDSSAKTSRWFDE